MYFQGVRAGYGKQPAWHIGGSGVMAQDFEDDDDLVGGKGAKCQDNPLASSEADDCNKLPRDMLWVREVMRIIQRSNMNYANAKHQVNYAVDEPKLGASSYMMDAFKHVMRFFVIGHSNGSQMVNKIAANGEMFPNVVMATGSASQTTENPKISDHAPLLFNVPASVRNCRTGEDCKAGAACD